MKLLAPFSLAITMLIANPATAQTPVAAPATASAISVKAQRLAEMLADVGNNDEASQKALTMIVAKMFVTNPELAELNATYPGLDQTIIETMRPYMLEHRNAILPGYRADLSRFYETNFTGAEIDELSRFYSSPLGRKSLTTMVDKMDFKATAAEFSRDLDDENAKASTAALKADTTRAAIRTMSALNTEERQQLMRFSRSPVAIKVNRLLPLQHALNAKWFNAAPSDELTKRMQDAILKAVDEHIDASATGEKSKTKKRAPVSDPGAA